MNNPIMSLAFSMQSNKGVYALLLGSGISRSAGIPTGWEIVIDLINKLAETQNEKTEPDPENWYYTKYHEEPHYSNLLQEIAKKPSERSQLLKQYFEPSDNEKEQKLKIPSLAHKAIARLIADGYIKVVITTNFDRLLENALEELGIHPIVISTPDAIIGAIPIVHSKCTIIKINGDYLDTRIKNSSEELKEYDKRTKTLLDRVFDEFGLVVCGWSAESDIALRDCIYRSKSRRYTTYWLSKGKPSIFAKGLIDFKQGQLIEIDSADAFFSDLQEKVETIEKYNEPHPLSAKMAVITLKRFLEDEKHEIQIHDLLIKETSQVCQSIIFEESPEFSPTPTKDEYFRRIKIYESNTEVLQGLMSCLGYWGKEKNEQLIHNCLEMLTEPLKQKTSYSEWQNLRLYPALQIFYSLGITCLARNNYELFGFIFHKIQNKYSSARSNPLFFDLVPRNVFSYNCQNWLPGYNNDSIYASKYLHDFLKPTLKDYIPEEEVFDELFDRFEYLQDMLIIDYDKFPLIPPSLWTKKKSIYGANISGIISKEMQNEKGEKYSSFLQLFDNSLERFTTAKEIVDQVKYSPFS